MKKSYERVSGMTAGQVLDEMLKGGSFYYPLAGSDSGFAPFTLKKMADRLDTGFILDGVYVVKSEEKYWWEGMKGLPVMVKSSRFHEWHMEIFHNYLYDSHEPFYCGDDEYKYARPLTAKERDEIKVVG